MSNFVSSYVPPTSPSHRITLGDNTIRQYPQNLLIAQRINNRWVVDPDGSADRKLVHEVFSVIVDRHMGAYQSGEQIVMEINARRAGK